MAKSKGQSHDELPHKKVVRGRVMLSLVFVILLFGEGGSEVGYILPRSCSVPVWGRSRVRQVTLPALATSGLGQGFFFTKLIVR